MTKESGFSDFADTTVRQERVKAFSIHAPIILDGTTREGVELLIDFVNDLKRQDNVAIAIAESDRLQPYIDAMSRHFEAAAGTEADKARTTPAKLSGFFNEMAVCTKNTLISHVAIVPMDTRSGPAKELFAERGF